MISPLVLTWSREGLSAEGAAAFCYTASQTCCQPDQSVTRAVGQLPELCLPLCPEASAEAMVLCCTTSGAGPAHNRPNWAGHPQPDSAPEGCTFSGLGHAPWVREQRLFLQELGCVWEEARQPLASQGTAKEAIHVKLTPSSARLPSHGKAPGLLSRGRWRDAAEGGLAGLGAGFCTCPFWLPSARGLSHTSSGRADSS